jgi:cell division protein FtsZ
VVATGIEADSLVQAQPAKVFTFPSRPVAAPAPAEPELGDEPEASADEADDEALELTEEVASDDDGDELLLDSDDILTSPVGAPPIAPPADDETASVEPDEDKPAEQAPKAAGAATGTGGTLFERMSSIARGAPRAQIDEEQPSADLNREPLDIPRFLNRQNNQ